MSQRLGWRAFVIACAVALVIGPAAVVAQTPAGEDLAGTLANGTKYSLHRPANWNGVLVLNADLPSMWGPRGAPFFNALHALGYATGGKARDITNWKIREGAGDLVQLKALFADRFAKPRTTIVTGGSLGGLVSRDAGEAYPDEFDGVVPTCGGGAGLIGMWNQRLDVVFTLKTLLAPNDATIELIGVTNDQRNGAALKALTERALQTPEGRARLALAAAIGQVSGWPTGAAAPPSPTDYDALLKTIAASEAGMLNLKSDLEKPAGGVMNWNVGIDYRALFNAADADTIAMAKELYRRAGLNLDADLATLAAAPRIQADASAIAWARGNGATTGRLRKPTLVLFTAVDPRAPQSEFRAYQKTVDAAGAAALLRQAGVYRSGHCVFSPVENLTALTLMAERLKTGRWPATTPEALNTRAKALSAQFGADVGEGKFAAFPNTPGYPRWFSAHSPLPPGALKPTP
ncbi:MAG TPA: hypothetical protein VG735_02905 [Caulobacterales bacterium]|nr:hypothetical protein [Caulobacterales bacterium]